MCHFTEMQGLIIKKKTEIKGAIIRQVGCPSFGGVIIWRFVCAEALVTKMAAKRTQCTLGKEPFISKFLPQVGHTIREGNGKTKTKQDYQRLLIHTSCFDVQVAEK